MGTTSRTRRALRTVLAGAVLALGLLHLVFGAANFQPGFPKLEGVAAIIAGLALLVAPVVGRRSPESGLMTVLLGTLPLVAWFAYAVPVEGSSGPGFFWASLVVPTTAGLAALVIRSRSEHRRTDRSRPS